MKIGMVVMREVYFLLNTKLVAQQISGLEVTNFIMDYCICDFNCWFKFEIILGSKS